MKAGVNIQILDGLSKGTYTFKDDNTLLNEILKDKIKKEAFSGRYFTCTKIEYSNGRVNKIYFVENERTIM